MSTFGRLVVIIGMFLILIVLIWGGMRWLERNAVPEVEERNATVKTDVEKAREVNPADEFCIKHPCKP